MKIDFQTNDERYIKSDIEEVMRENKEEHD